MGKVLPSCGKEGLLQGVIPSFRPEFPLRLSHMDILIRIYRGKSHPFFPLSQQLTSTIQTGTTLLVALPLGAVLCFFDLLGARAFSRGELFLQARFHGPLIHLPPYHPRPLFTRYREPTPEEYESRRLNAIPGGPPPLVKEESFYKNTYAMVFHSYQTSYVFLSEIPSSLIQRLTKLFFTSSL
jgi:hypothetical protein